MKKVGVTGHQSLPPDALEYISRKMDQVLRELGGGLLGFSSLADGADQLFARALLDRGGRLHVVVPSDNYEASFADAAASEAYASLLSQAEQVERLPHAKPSEDAYLDAGYRIVDQSDVILAVWDGRSARGRGGTADIVDYARKQRRRVVVIWPPDVERD